MTFRAAAVLILFGLLVPAVAVGASRPTEPPRKIAPFTLKDPRDGKPVALVDLRDRKAIVVVFLGTECPINNAFVPVLAELHQAYSARGVAFLGINSNRQDTPDKVAAHARKFQVPFPLLKDVNAVVADQFGARRTPEAFLLGPDGKVLYQGRIDDQFGIGYSRAGKPSRRDLAVALDEVLAGKPVSVARTEVAGCFIGRTVQPRKDGPITYTKQVSRILQNHCQECHRPGQIGPMALLTYEDAASWADTIREVVSDQRMPPWHADPRFGKFSNDRRLPEADRAALLAWLEEGTPRGDDRDLPAARQFTAGWKIGQPDLVFTMPKAFDVPAETPVGGVPYQHFTVETNFKEDRWVERAEARPDALDVVHHIVVFIVGPNEKFQPGIPRMLLTGFAPGDMPTILEPGFAKKVPAGARLVFQMHYTPNGKARRDQSSVGLIFAKEPPKYRVLTRPVASRTFAARATFIPPGADNFKVESEFQFPEKGHILSFMPHMHLRGKDFLYEAQHSDGKATTLLSVPRYQFGWQAVYRCAEPVPMAKGSKLHCVAHYDNSAGNPNNPDPTAKVYWGDQTWQEMMIGWIDFYLDEQKP